MTWGLAKEWVCMGEKATDLQRAGFERAGFQRAKAGSGEYGRTRSDQRGTDPAGIEQLRELIDGGDWACANGQTSTLLHICQQLTPTLDKEHASRASQIALWLETDLLRATELWSDLARDLDRAPH